MSSNLPTVLSLAALATSVVVAPSSAVELHTGVGWGTHAVGYRLLETVDPARSGHRGDDPGRRLRLQLWYPANAGAAGSALLLADYEIDVEHGVVESASPAGLSVRTAQLAKLVEETVDESIPLAAARRLYELPVAARRGAPRASGSWPLLLAVGVDPLLCEYLASLGYVVVQPSARRWGFGMSDSVEDLGFAAREAMRELGLTSGPAAALGFSRSALVALQYAMRDLDLAAVVSFDGVEIWKAWQGRAMELPWFEPELVALPILRFDDAAHPAVDIARDAFYGRTPFVDLDELHFTGITHSDLALGLRSLAAPGLSPTPLARATLVQHEIRVALRVFLDAKLKGESAAAAELAAKRQGSAAVQGASWEHRPALFPSPPTTEEAIELVEREGAKAFIARMEKPFAHPGFRLPSRYWSEVMSAAFARSDFAAAAELTRAFESQAPNEIAPAYFDAIVRQRQGDLTGAEAGFRRALARGSLPATPSEPPLTRESLLHRSALALTRLQAQQSAPAAASAARWRLAAAAGPPILLDGRCDEAEWRGAAVLELGDGYRLRARQHGELVALCLPVPDGSWGALDLFLLAPGFATPLNLHVSAKLGERFARADGSYADWTWWNAEGWSAAVARWDRVEGERPQFLPLADRELVLRTSRFGCGPWRLRFEPYDGASGGDAPHLPAGARLEDPSSWIELTLAEESCSSI